MQQGYQQFMKVMMHARWLVELDVELEVLAERGLNRLGFAAAAQMASSPTRSVTFTGLEKYG
jgi:hypothetical protein